MNTDKNKTTRTPTRLTVVLLLWSMTATTPLLIPSCSHDDPATEEKANHRPGEGNNGSGENGNGSSGGEEGETPGNTGQQPAIVGSWLDHASAETHTFGADGSYTLTESAGETAEEGSYTYSDLKQHLYISIDYISIDNDRETFVRDYRCVISDNSMTLTDISGNKKELTRTGD